MHSSNRGHLKNRVLVSDRKNMENMRRLMATSLFLVVLFSIIWGYVLVKGAQSVPAQAVWFGFITVALGQAGFGIYGYRWLSGKEKSTCTNGVRSYWAFNFFCFSILVFLSDAMVEAMMGMGVLLLIFSMVPLLDREEYLIVSILEMVVGISTCVRGQIDLEHFSYLLVMGGLCSVISRQTYRNFLRQVEDWCKLDSAKIQAETDPMTGLLNRRGLERRLAAIWPMLVRQKLEVAVIMMDIDNFKRYNDAFGHPQGDECIKAVAEKIKNCTARKTDYAARVGGEEFLVFLTGISQADALKWARKCKESIEEMVMPHSKDNFLPFVSISMGVGLGMPYRGIEFFPMQNEADRCLYQAKENGKACIFIKEQCYAKTSPQMNRQNYYLERGFRSLG